MVSISRQRLKGGKVSSTRRTRSKYDVEKLMTVGLAGLGGCVVIWMLLYSMSGGDGGTSGSKSRLMSPNGGGTGNHPDLHLQGPNSEAYNAIALDIIQTLQCRELLNKTVINDTSEEARFNQQEFEDRQRASDQEAQEQQKQEEEGGGGEGAGEEGHFRRRRRLEEENGEGGFMMDDFAGGDGGAAWDYSVTATAAHLFCLAAMGNDAWEKLEEWKSRMKCDPTSSEQRQLALLDIWSTARSEMPENVLMKTLEVATEHERDLVQERMQLWAPTTDDGLEYMLGVLNEEQKNVDHGGIYGLETNLGRGKLFVDVGGGLGLTSMAIALLYPGTRIVSLEAAAPNWLLEQVNWNCNTDNDKLANADRTILLSGVGPSERSAQMAKFMWRPTATTSTRSWTPASERQDGDVELVVKLRPWHSILAEAGVDKNTIDVLNVHCEGCEYNLIPSLSQDEFEAIRTVMGSVHWGYIPTHKLPSSKRAKITHERLCRHENFARGVKECCAFPDLPVLSSVPGEVLVHEDKGFPPHDVTVKDVAGGLCDNFDTWAAENHLYDIESDWGWFQITSMAE